MTRSPAWSRVTWLAVLMVAVGSLVASEAVERAPRTNAERVHALAGDFACPVCQGQSLAESDVPVARTIRAAMRTMVDEGRTDDQVRLMLVERFGEQVDYTPTGRGLTGLVWILPVVGGAMAVVAVGAVGMAVALLLVGLTAPGKGDSHLGFNASLVLMGFSGAIFSVPLRGFMVDRAGEDRRGRVLASSTLLSNLFGLGFIGT